MMVDLRSFVSRAFVGIACAIGVALPAGCGKTPEKSAPPEETGKSGSVAAKSAPGKKTSAAKPQPKQQPRGESPDKALRELLAGLRAGKPQALWEFLPPGYRRDVNDLVHEFAAAMDAELWNRTFAVGRRTVKLLKTRKPEIMRSEAWQRIDGFDRKRFEQDFDGFLAMAELLVHSDLAELQKLKTIDVGRFLATTGQGIVNRLPGFSEMLPANAKVKLLSTDGNTAKLQLIDGENVSTVEFVRVEGKWIHQSLAAGWDASIGRIRREFKTKLEPKQLALRKRNVLKNLGEFEKRLDALERAQPGDEFQQRLAGSPLLGFLIAMFRDPGSLPGVVGTAFPDAARNAPQGGSKLTVLVIVEGVLDAKTANRVGDELFQLGDYDLGDVRRDGESTLFPVSEVADFETLRKQIRFAEVVSADAEKLEIRLRLKSAQPNKEKSNKQKSKKE